MTAKGKLLQICLLGVLLFLPAAGRAQFTFTTNHGAITITGYLGTNAMVAIPDTTNGYPVTSIGNSAFFDASSVTNVSIPGSVTNIDVQAFTRCGLVSVVIPDSVLNIGQSAFLDCSSLISVAIGAGVLSIGDDAFYGCAGLTNVLIPSGVTNLYSTAFNYCVNLGAINVAAENPAYGSVAGVVFDKNQTRLVEYPGGGAGSYTIPGTVTSIGDYAFFADNNLTNVIIPQGVATIGLLAFAGTSLTKILIPDSVTTIGPDAFSEGGLTSVVIPASVTNIGTAAFSGASLTAITVDTNNPSYCSVAGVLFDVSQTTLVEYPRAKSGSFFQPGSYSIPNGVIHIGDAAFEDAFFLGSVIIPDSVTTIGSSAFGDCPHLLSLIIPNSVTNIGDGAFASTGLTNLLIPAGVTTLGVLGYCPDLHSIYFEGNAPGEGAGLHLIAYLNNNCTAYYLPGTTGWGQYFQTTTIPTAPWLPQAQTAGTGFGARTNQFGFMINWAAGQTVVVAACTNLLNPVWQPVQTNTLATGSAYFSDPQWTNHPGRFYRVRPL